MRILLVEDSKAESELATFHLKQLGHEAVIAPNWVRALKLLVENGIDGAILDWMIPDIAPGVRQDAIALLATHLPIVIHTGMPDDVPHHLGWPVIEKDDKSYSECCTVLENAAVEKMLEPHGGRDAQDAY
jgi:hypothetical protein